MLMRRLRTRRTVATQSWNNIDVVKKIYAFTNNKIKEDENILCLITWLRFGDMGYQNIYSLFFTALVFRLN